MSIKEYKKQFIELLICLEEEHGTVKRILLGSERSEYDGTGLPVEVTHYNCEIEF